MESDPSQQCRSLLAHVAADLEEFLDIGEVVERELEFFHDFGDKFFGFQEFFLIIEFFVADPLERVQLVVVVLDLIDVKTPPATVS